METTPAQIRKALKELKPRYLKKYEAPAFCWLHVSNKGQQGIISCVDKDKKTDKFFVKMVTFECQGPDATFTIKPAVLKDLAQAGVTDLRFVFTPYYRERVVIQADDTYFELDMLDPDDFPRVSSWDGFFHTNRSERILSALYSTTHMDQVRHNKCLAILKRMRSLSC